MGGVFQTPSGQHGLAEFRPDGTATGFDADLTQPVVEALTVVGGRLVAGGIFAGSHGQEHHALVALDASGSPQPFAGDGLGLGCSSRGGTIEPSVSALAAGGGRLWVGGLFSGVGYPNSPAAQRTGPLAAVASGTGLPGTVRR